MKKSRLSALIEFEDGITIMPVMEGMNSKLKVGEIQDVKWSDGKYYEGYVIAIGNKVIINTKY